MQFIEDIFGNIFALSAFFGWLSAQIIKTIIHWIVTKKFVPERLLGNGGMPSSHSATVTSLATSIYWVYGAGSCEFAVALIFAIVVMHDASGVRREAGRHSKALNELMKLLDDKNGEISPTQKFKEFVGHTPIQVFVGAVLGILVACIIRGLYTG